MDITKDILPMTAFRNHSADVMQHLRETKRPVILTVNGKAAAASAAEGIRQGLEDLKSGRTHEARAVFDDLRREHGLPR